MLGVRRTTVTIAARLLQSAGLIRYRRGLIQIVDRRALENIACECYAVVRHNADKIFPALGEACERIMRMLDHDVRLLRERRRRGQRRQRSEYAVGKPEHDAELAFADAHRVGEHGLKYRL